VNAAQLARLRAELPNMSATEREHVVELLHDYLATERPDVFIRRVSPHHPPPRHIQPILDLFERGEREQVFACVSMPPGHTKTLTVLHCLAWWMQHHGGDTNAYLTYNEHKAWSESRRARSLATVAGVEFGDAENLGEWQTAEGGAFLAAGAGAGIMGRRVSGWCVYDDPYKNRQDADSDDFNTKIWETLTETMIPRLEGGSMLVVHQRWNPDDLIGRLVEEKGWEHIGLSALAEEGDLLGRAAGEALWADNPLYTAEELAKIRDIIGEWSFAALYQGRPRPRGHKVFGTETYRSVSLEGFRRVIYGDPAASEKTTADDGAMLALDCEGYGPEMRCHVVEVRKGHWTVPEYTRKFRAFQDKYGGVEAWVESVAGFKAVAQTLKEIDPDLRVKEDYPEGDKFQRAQSPAAAWGRGLITVPPAETVDWDVKGFLKEIQRFTGVGARKDNQVDCLTGAYNVARRQKPVEYPKQTGGLYRPRR
jgi:phage terminase large subunit-like protein